MNTNIRELMLAGAHFGHRTRFWNPKMAGYIYGKYHSTHIINLDHTIQKLATAADFLKSVIAGGGGVLYLCTKTFAADIIEEEAQAVKMPYISKRWLGGMLTNFKTTRNSVERLFALETRIAEGVLRESTKKEGLKLMTQKEKLDKAIGGIRDMKVLPEALFVIDAGWHKGAVREANKLGIPVVAVVDTNHSPDNIDYVIPGNDDSREAVKLYVREISAAITEGKRQWEETLVADITAAGGGVRSDDEEEAVRHGRVITAKKGAGNKTTVVDEVAKKPVRVIQAKKSVVLEIENNGAESVKEMNDEDAGTAKTEAQKPAEAVGKGEGVTISAAVVKSLRDATGAGMMECKKALVECDGDFEKARDLLRIKSGAKAEKVAGRTASEGRIAFAKKDGVGALIEINCETDFVARDDNMAAFAKQAAQAAAVAVDSAGDIVAAVGRELEESRSALVMKLGENISVRRLVRLTAAADGGIACYVHAGDKVAAMCAYQGDEMLAYQICMHIAAMRPRYVDKDDVPTAVIERERKIFAAQAEESGKPADIAEKMAAGKMDKYLSDITLLNQNYVRDTDRRVGDVLKEGKTSVSALAFFVVGEAEQD